MNVPLLTNHCELRVLSCLGKMLYKTASISLFLMESKLPTPRLWHISSFTYIHDWTFVHFQLHVATRESVKPTKIHERLCAKKSDARMEAAKIDRKDTYWRKDVKLKKKSPKKYFEMTLQKIYATKKLRWSKARVATSKQHCNIQPWPTRRIINPPLGSAADFTFFLWLSMTSD